MVSQSEIDRLRREGKKEIESFVDKNKEHMLKKISLIFLSGIAVTKKYLNFSREVNISSEEKRVFTDLVGESIKGVTEDYLRELNTSLNIGLTQSETKKELKQRINNILKGNNPTKLKYKYRLDLILRTESSRIFNSGAFKTAKKAGAKFKYLVGTDDNRQGKDSKVALRKYGEPKKAIPINQEFTFREGKKVYSYLFPPNRPNDREVVIFLFEKPNS